MISNAKKYEIITKGTNTEKGFSLIELIVSLVITLIILGIAVAVFSSSLSSRLREGSKTDAITSAQAALNIMTREIGNSGYGLQTNGLIWFDSNGIAQTDSNERRLHFRANTSNNDYFTDDPGEDVTFYYDSNSLSVVRYDAYNGGSTSGIINRVSEVEFEYHNYNPDGSYTISTTPAPNTGKVKITLKVILDEVTGQPTNQTVKVSSDVTLRNSTYMLGQY